MFSFMPYNLNYSFNFGIVLVVSSIFLIISGILSVIFYNNNLDFSFLNLILHSFNSFNYFFLRVFHNTFANLFFFFIFLHIFRSWFFSSYNVLFTLLSGIAIFFLSCGIAFFGYCLPMGQMSYWAAVVIFSLLSVIPFGFLIILYLFGSFSISTRTLSLLFFFHFIFPFVLLVLILIHFYYLHLNLSSQTSLNDYLDLVTFFPYFFILDLFVIFYFFLLVVFIVFFFSFYFFESANWSSFETMVTPLHIYPDWFLLFPYACLRSVDSKGFGVLLLLIVLMSLFFPSSLLSSLKLSNFFKFFQVIVLNFFIFFTFIGGNPSVVPYSLLIIYSQYLLYLFFILYIFMVFLIFCFRF